MIGLLEFDIVLSKMLVIACNYQLLILRFNFIMFSTFAKQNPAKKIASDVRWDCSMLVIYILFDLVWKRPSSFIINFEKFMKSFYFELDFLLFTFYHWLTEPFYKSKFIYRHDLSKCIRSNMVQKSSFSFLAGFETPNLMKMYSVKEVYINTSRGDSC